MLGRKFREVTAQFQKYFIKHQLLTILSGKKTMQVPLTRTILKVLATRENCDLI